MIKHFTLLLFIGLAFWSCEDEQDNVVSPSNEVDIDWCLVKTPNYRKIDWTSDGEVIIEGIGYHFYFIGASNITDLNLVESETPTGWTISDNTGIISFYYNGENFSYDLNDSFDSELGFYRIQSITQNDSFYPLQRIIYNEDMNYFTLFGNGGFFGIELSSSSPNELIDYR